MIKTDNIDEYASLKAMQTYCLTYSGIDCNGCRMKPICNCIAIVPADFKLEFEQKEMLENEKNND